jgi:NADH-quinone oxidoreductase subunit C
MTPEEIRSLPEAAALEAHEPGAVLDAKRDRGEVTLEIAAARVAGVCEWLCARGYRLSSVTATDWHPLEPRFRLAYHLHSIAERKRLRLAVRLPGDSPRVASVVPVWPGANWYEREVFDLFGIHFTGHPDLRRILMPEDWEGHPLRKDFPVEGIR